MSSLAHLTDRAIVSVSGPEASAFLQGLITNDTASLKEDAAMYAALLTPQGKILFDFLVVSRDGGFLLDTPAVTADALVKRLTLYRLRSKVTIARRDDLAVLAGWDNAQLPSPHFIDPRLPALGQRAIVARDSIPHDAAGPDVWHAHRLDCAVPEGADFGQDKIFALDANLDELHAVSFEKGCYVGQELTARMKHRGTARKRVLPVATLDGAPLAVADVATATLEIGSVISTSGARGFALIRLDRLAESQDAELNVAGTRVRVTKPAWLSA
jgi:folate-binding protein YgfZ